MAKFNLHMKSLLLIIIILFVLYFGCACNKKIYYYMYDDDISGPIQKPKGIIELLFFSTTTIDTNIVLPKVIGGIEEITSKVLYPDIARRAGVKGVIICQFIVDTLGNSKKCEIIKGIGAGCDETAIEAIKKAQYLPAKRNGKKIDIKMRASFNFILKY